MMCMLLVMHVLCYAWVDDQSTGVPMKQHSHMWVAAAVELPATPCVSAAVHIAAVAAAATVKRLKARSHAAG